MKTQLCCDCKSELLGYADFDRRCSFCNGMKDACADEQAYIDACISLQEKAADDFERGLEE